MSTQKQKFELFRRLGELGFTYEEAVALRRIEMTLHRWAEQECGDSNSVSSWAIERDEKTDRPYRCVYPHNDKSYRYPIADREAGALRRLAAIIDARNSRFHREATANRLQNYRPFGIIESVPVLSFHQTDPRGCALYLIRAGDLPMMTDDELAKIGGPGATATPKSRLSTILSSHYTRGLAVCA